MDALFIAVQLRSTRRLLGNETGGAIAGADRAFDGGGQAGSVQSPASTRLRHARFGARTLGILAGVAAKVARRSRTICQGGSAAGKPVTLATSAQMVFASSSRGVSISRSPALIVTDSRPGKANIHSTVPLMTPRIGGCPAGGSMRKCALTMARNSVGASRPRHQRRRRIGRHGKDHGIIRGKRNRLAAEIERLDAVRRRSDGAKLMLEPHVGAASLRA